MVKKNKKMENIIIREVKEKDICKIYNINKILFKEDKWSYEELEERLLKMGVFEKKLEIRNEKQPYKEI